MDKLIKKIFTEEELTTAQIIDDFKIIKENYDNIITEYLKSTNSISSKLDILNYSGLGKTYKLKENLVLPIILEEFNKVKTLVPNEYSLKYIIELYLNLEDNIFPCILNYYQILINFMLTNKYNKICLIK